MSHGYQFIGPLRPGQKPPPRPSPAEASSSWSILDLLEKPRDSAAGASNQAGRVGKAPKQKKFIRSAGGTTWEDPTLADWDPDDYRVFVGDLGNDVTDELLTKTFKQYPSFVRAKVVRDKRTGKPKGYGFISFKEAQDYVKAIKEWDGEYLGCRPIKLRKSQWKDRQKTGTATGSATPSSSTPATS